MTAPNAAKAKPGKLPTGQFETKDEKAALEYYAMMKAGRKSKKDDESSGADSEPDEDLHPKNDDELAE